MASRRTAVMALVSRPVSSGVLRRAPTMAPREGCEVVPDMASKHASTASAPALAAAIIEATPVPAVSCVCTWKRVDEAQEVRVG